MILKDFAHQISVTVVIQRFTLCLLVQEVLLQNQSLGITCANKSTSGVTVDIFIDNEDGSNDVFIVKNATIPAGASLEVMSGNKLVLQNDGSNGDNLEALASAASAVDITVSVLEDV